MASFIRSSCLPPINKVNHQLSRLKETTALISTTTHNQHSDAGPPRPPHTTHKTLAARPTFYTRRPAPRTPRSRQSRQSQQSRARALHPQHPDLTLSGFTLPANQPSIPSGQNLSTRTMTFVEPRCNASERPFIGTSSQLRTRRLTTPATPMTPSIKSTTAARPRNYRPPIVGVTSQLRNRRLMTPMTPMTPVKHTTHVATKANEFLPEQPYESRAFRLFPSTGAASKPRSGCGVTPTTPAETCTMHARLRLVSDKRLGSPIKDAGRGLKEQLMAALMRVSPANSKQSIFGAARHVGNKRSAAQTPTKLRRNAASTLSNRGKTPPTHAVPKAAKTAQRAGSPREHVAAMKRIRPLISKPTTSTAEFYAEKIRSKHTTVEQTPKTLRASKQGPDTASIFVTLRNAPANGLDNNPPTRSMPKASTSAIEAETTRSAFFAGKNRANLFNAEQMRKRLRESNTALIFSLLKRGSANGLGKTPAEANAAATEPETTPTACYSGTSRARRLLVAQTPLTLGSLHLAQVPTTSTYATQTRAYTQRRDCKEKVMEKPKPCFTRRKKLWPVKPLDLWSPVECGYKRLNDRCAKAKCRPSFCPCARPKTYLRVYKCPVRVRKPRMMLVKVKKRKIVRPKECVRPPRTQAFECFPKPPPPPPPPKPTPKRCPCFAPQELHPPPPCPKVRCAIDGDCSKKKLRFNPECMCKNQDRG